MTWKDVEIKEGISLEKNRIREDLTVFLRVRSMRARLARLTPSSRDKKKKTDPPVRSLGRTTNIRFHGIEGLCCQHSFSFHLKFTVRQTRLMAALLAVVCGHGLPVHVRFESGEDSRRRAWLIEIQMSISSVRAYILTRRRGEERSECGVLFVSWMSKTVAWIAPMFALEFCRPGWMARVPRLPSTCQCCFITTLSEIPPGVCQLAL